MAIRLYTKMFRKQGQTIDAGFHSAFWNYIAGIREFSPERMALSAFKMAHEDNPRKVPLDIVVIWSALDNQSFTGRNSFIKLAIHVLSIVPNSAGAERTFSQMGQVHSALRNRTNAQLIHKEVIFKMDLKVRYDFGTSRSQRRFKDFANVQTLRPANISTAITAVNSEMASSAVPSPSGSSAIAAVRPFALEALAVLASNNSEPDNTEPQEAIPYLMESERLEAISGPLVASAEEDDNANSHDAEQNWPRRNEDGDSPGVPEGESSTGDGPGEPERTLASDDIAVEEGLLLRNLFDYETEERFGTFCWQKGVISLEAEMDLYEFLTVGGME
ncbi:unnamed protein product [Somion occarium]|uniref:HAT C-terminal dimerisation domain-containing protein n=1 Tax=Somion occarium TaxID=3059160 RepID=A0ABP1E6V2_9APHY